MPITHAAVAGTPAVAGKIAGPEWDAAHVGNSFGWYNVVESPYGADPTGVADSTTAINAAITACNAAGGGTVYVPPGIYLVLSLALKSNVRLLGAGVMSILRKNGGSGATSIINVTGTLSGTTQALSANAAANASSVAASANAGSLAAGDTVLIRDATYKYDGTTGRNQELNRIASVSGSFTFNLTDRTLASYATASTAQIIKVTPVNDASIENLFLQVPVGTSGGNVATDLATNLTISRCRFSGSWQMGNLDTQRSAHIRFVDNDIRDNQTIDVDSGLGVAISESTHDVQITGNRFENYNQNPFTNNARDVLFAFNTLLRATQDAVNTHGTGCERITIAYNVINGADQFGISVSASDHATDRDVSVIGNMVSNTAASAISATAPAGIEVKNLLISGNVVRSWNTGNGGNEFGIIAAGCWDVSIADNNLDGGGLAVAQTGIRVQDCKDVNVIGNVVGNLTGSATGISHYQTDGLTIAHNQISDVNGGNIVSLGGTMTRCVVRNNQADDATYTKGVGERWEGNIWGLTSDPGDVRAFALASAHAISSTTATEVTGLGPCTLQPGTYTFVYSLLAQSATATVSPMFGINFTGTAAVRSFKLRYPGTGTTAITGVADDVGGVTGQIEESQAMNGFVTTPPNMGATGGVAATGTNILYIIEGVLIVTAVGDLELWHGSETATSTTVSAGSSLVVTHTA